MSQIQSSIQVRPSTVRALFLVAGRVEYFAADLLPYLIGFFIGMSTVGQVYSTNLTLLLFFEGMLVVILAHYSTVHINVLADYDLDKRFKSQLSDAVDVIGKRRLMYIVITTILGATLLILHLCLFTNRWILLPLWVIGISSGFAYSYNPPRLKEHLFVGDLGRLIPLVILVPFGYFLINPNTSPVLYLTVLGLSVNLFGLFMIGEVWDYKDDLNSVRTFATVFGYKISLLIGGFLIPIGVTIWVIGIVITGGISPLIIIYLVGSILLLAAIIYNYLRIYRQRDNYELIEGKCGLATTVWTTSLWFSLLVGAVLLFLSKII